MVNSTQQNEANGVAPPCLSMKNARRVGTDVYRVGKGWVADVRGIPMGMRWECSRDHFDRYRASVYSWVLSVNATGERPETRSERTA